MRNKFERNIKPIRPPYTARLEKDGTHTQMVHIDIMLEEGSKYYATWHHRFPCIPDLRLGKYVTVLDDMEKITKLILSQFPSLSGREFILAFA